MLKKLLLAGLLAAVLMLTGCALIEMDEEVDAASVVITMGDKTFTKGEVAAQIETYYGDLSGYDAQYKRDVQENVVNAMIQQEMMDRKVKEWGLDQLTAEEENQVKAVALEMEASDRAGVRQDMFGDSTLSEEEIEAGVTAYLSALGATQESYEAYARTQIIEEKLIAHVLGDVTVTDEELQLELGWMAENDQLEFSENLQGYEERVNAGERAYYTPAGYRYVKMIKRVFLAEDKAKSAQIEAQLADSDDAALNEQLAQAKAAAYENLQGSMAEITGRMEAGESFDALLNEYNQDILAQTSPVRERGYALSADSDTPSYEIVLAAMALKKPGDVSQPVKLEDGMAILRYEADIAEGPIALDEVKAELEASVMNSKREVLFYEQLQAWTAEADAKVDYNVLNR